MESVLNRIRNIDWFKNVGKELENNSLLRVYRWEDTLENVKYVGWEKTNLKKQDDLYTYLSENYPDEIMKIDWYIHTILRDLNSDILPEIKVLCDNIEVEDNLYYDIQWHLLHVLLFDKYNHTNHKIDFYNKILEFYELGHVPCGYKDGVFIVY